MKNSIIKVVFALLIIFISFLIIKNNQFKSDLFKEREANKIEQIKGDSLKKISEGYYQKLIADTLTKKQLKELAAEIIELKNRKPVSVIKTIIQPVRIEKETDSILVDKDSVYIIDYYPNKDNPFLKYTNNFSLINNKGISNFDFNTINISQVVTKKQNGLYQVDFKGPDFLQVNSLDIQTEPIVSPIKDNWGTLIGVEYGKNLENKTNLLELNIYQRYKKLYIGASISTNKDIKGGIKIEL